MKSAIITADVIQSRQLEAIERKQLYEQIEQLLNVLKKNGQIQYFGMFRGDSLQCMCTKASESLAVAILIRAFILSLRLHQQKNKKGYTLPFYDIKLSIGIGEVDFINKENFSVSDGEAFVLSGQGLDELKDFTMMAKTGDIHVNEELRVMMILLDSLIKKWTIQQAEIVYHKLLDKKEEEISNQMGISQSAINQRSNGAQWLAVTETIKRYESLIKN